MNEQPNRKDEIRVHVDTDLVKGWFVSERSPGDRPEKKHLILLVDEDDNVVSHTWMTTEEYVKIQLERKFERRV